MITRRIVWSSMAMLPAMTIARTGSADECQAYTKPRQQALSPADALRLLREGNERFVANKPLRCDLPAQVRATAAGQAPYAAIVGCIDSRASPELIFDQHIGDIFAARVAGNFVNDDIIASLEFAAKLVGVRALVVLGHTDCGAVKGAIDGAQLGHLTRMFDNIRPAIEASRSVPGERSSKNPALMHAVTETNARLAAAKLTERSEVLRELVAQKQLAIAAAVHDLATGKVTFLA
jgi:carbonic anhydrase